MNTDIQEEASISLDLSLHESEGFKEQYYGESELSYDAPFANKESEPLIVRYSFNLHVLFFFTFNALVLYIYESYAAVFYRNTPENVIIYYAILTMYIIVFIDILNLACQLIYVHLVKTVYPTKIIGIFLGLEMTGVVCVAIMWYNSYRAVIALLRCYRMFYFYALSQKQLSLLIFLENFILFYGFIFHTSTCAFALTCRDCSGPTNPGNTFMNSELSQTIYKLNGMEYLTPWKWYFLSNHYILGAVSYNGANSSANVYEILIAIITMMFGSAAKMLLVCDTCIRCNYVKKHDTEYRLMISQVVKQMRNTEEYTKVKLYYWGQLVRSPFVGIDEHLYMIPHSLASDLMLDIFWFALTQSWVFQHESKQFLRKITMFMHTKEYHAGEYVYKHRDRLHKLYFVAEGSVGILIHDDNTGKVLTLGVGTVFGDTNLMYPMYSQYTVVANEYTLLHILTMENMWRVIVSECELMVKRRFWDKAKNRVRYAIRKSLIRPSKSVSYLIPTLKKFLPKEKQLQIYHPRNCYKINSFQYPYSCYVLSNLYDETQMDNICFYSKFPWKILQDASILYIWNYILTISIPIVNFFYLYYIFVLEATNALEFRFLYTCATLIYSLDVAVQLITVRDKHAPTMHEIFMNRLKSFHFYVDIVSAFPWDWIIDVSVSPKWYLGLHLIKIYRLKVFMLRSFGRCSYFKRWYIWLGGFFMDCFYILEISYTLSCVSFWVFREFAINSSDTFDIVVVKASEIVFQVNMDAPKNIYEIMFLCSAGIWGLYIMIYILGNTLSYFRLELSQTRLLYRMIKECRQFCRDRKLPTELEPRILAYLQYQYEWEVRRGVLNIPKHTCKNTKVSWSVLIYREILEDCPLFRGIPFELLGKLSVSCRMKFYPPGEIIFKGGVYLDELYLLVDGCLMLISPKTGILQKFVESDSLYKTVGTLNLLLHVRYPYNIRACTHVKLISIPREDIFKVYSMRSYELAALNSALRGISLEQLHVKLPTGYASGYDATDDRYTSWFIFPKSRHHPVHKEWKRQFDKAKYFGPTKNLLMMRTLLPYGNFLYYWEIFRANFVWAACLHDYFTYYFWDSFFLVEICTHFIFLGVMLIDIYLQFHVCYFNKKGVLVLHPRKTVVHYIKTRFTLDIICTFPYQLCYIIMKVPYFWAKLSFQHYILVGFFKYLLLVRSFKELWNYDRFIGNHKIAKYMIFYLYTMVIMIHFQVQLFMLISSQTIFLETILEKNEHIIPKHKTFLLEVKTSFHYYLSGVKRVSFNFLMSHCNNLYDTYYYGFVNSIIGRYLPWGPWGYQVKLSNLLPIPIPGYLLFGFLLSYVGSVYEVMQIKHTMSTPINTLKVYMKLLKVKPYTQKSVLTHLTYVHIKYIQQSLLQDVTLKKLSKILRQDIQLHILKPTLDLIPLVCFDSDIHRQLSEHLQEGLMLEGNIFMVNDVIDSLYILQEGEVTLMSGGSRNVIATLTKGSIFGNFDSVKYVRSMVTALCTTPVSFLKISTSEFYMLIDKKLEEALEEYITVSGNASYIPAEHVVVPTQTNWYPSLNFPKLNDFMSKNSVILQTCLGLMVITLVVLMGCIIFIFADGGPEGNASERFFTALFNTISIWLFRGQKHCTASTSSVVIIIAYVIVARAIFFMYMACCYQILDTFRRRIMTYRFNIERFRQTLIRLKASYRLKIQVSNYILNFWTYCDGLLLDDVLQEIPRPLVYDIKMDIFKKFVIRNPIWQGCHSAFLRQLVGYIKLKPYFNEDVICREGAMDGTMYFVYSGCVELSIGSHLEYIVDLLGVGDCFGGVQGLFPEAKHIYTFTSRNVTEVCSLTFSDWEHLLDFFPATKFIVYENIKRLIGKTKKVDWEDVVNVRN